MSRAATGLLNNIFKLADIAWPGIVSESLKSIVGDRRNVLAREFGCIGGQKSAPAGRCLLASPAAAEAGC